MGMSLKIPLQTFIHELFELSADQILKAGCYNLQKYNFVQK